MFSKSSNVFIKVLLLTLLTPLYPSMVLSRSIFDDNTNEIIANNNDIVTVETFYRYGSPKTKIMTYGEFKEWRLEILNLRGT